MRRLRLWILVAAASAVGGGCSVAGEDSPSGSSQTTRVVTVVDGDTIHVRLDGRRERLRYIGIDTPEIRPQAACFGEEAKAFNARLVSGERVRLERDVSERDRYGRLLAYVYRVRDGLFVNAELVRRGYAQARAYPPDERYAARLESLERNARQERRGLWRTCARARTQ